MLEKTFDPKAAEPRHYAQWEASGLFAPRERAATDGAADAYSIVIPPPNVTGSLHIGHALNNTLQDILARYHRMKGEAVLWLPGTDHAGIATQMVVERQLAASGNMSRRSCWTMVPPLSAFHSQTLSTKASRPIDRRSALPAFASSRSTTIWVAMPAWSVPGSHSTALPFIR